jgi:hypothetical protein
MRKKRIFIGSASETRDQLAAPVARHLSEAGFEVVRWWEAFGIGELTLPRLQEIAATVDGAVLVCLGTERTWYRGESVDAPRDNVILELGLFLQSVGPKRAVVITTKSTKLPSDLSGVTYLANVGDTTSVAEKVVAHFRTELMARRDARILRAIRIEVDPKVADAVLGTRAPRGWHQRSLYLGTEGSRNWLAVSEDPIHLSSVDLDQVRAHILAATKGLRPRSFVSLGPGSGELDREIAISLRDRSLQYFPVDISEGLLFRACEVLSQHAVVPLGILSDFEERLPFILERLESQAERPLLVGLLGHTLCNLDRFEATFLRQLESWLEPGDQVLIEVAVASESWDVKEAPLDANQHTASRKRFFSDGLARQLGVPVDVILGSYESRIAQHNGRSDVPSAISVDIIDSVTNTRIQNFRWYRWEAFLEWVSTTFDFEIRQQSVYYYAGKGRGEGIALLERRDSR